MMADDTAAAAPDSPEPDEAQEARTAKRRKLLRILALVVPAVALLLRIWYFLTPAGRVSTDKAYVLAERPTAPALLPGPVDEVYAPGTHRGRTVKEGFREER